VTLDDDVAALLDKLLRGRQLTRSKLVNTAMRIGLAQLEDLSQSDGAFETRVADTGRALVPDVDNVAQTLDHIEGGISP
jgi:hypothetical protein